ncbi:DUF4245 family protein [Aquipuribacter nitratireducens]|uniref:DUF4245 family protein n=1 Tax=Aquipuribacter nitratireducens TaxID=650104 RepID=A0ABW0GR18_9MICO
MSEQARPPRRGARGTALDMVRSLAVILVLVAGVLVLAPMPGEVRQPAVDTTVALAAADAARAEVGLEPVLPLGGPAPEGAAAATPSGQAVTVVTLGEGWQVDYARSQVVEDVPTWRVGLLSPDDRRVDVEQARDVTERWLARADDASVLDAAEPLEVGGTTWWRYTRGDDRTTYRFDGPAGTTTLVHAADDVPALVDVVEAVSPVLNGR